MSIAAINVRENGMIVAGVPGMNSLLNNCQWTYEIVPSSEHWLLSIRMPPLPEEISRGKALYEKYHFTNRLKAGEFPPKDEIIAIQAYERYAFSDNPKPPKSFAEDEDFRFCKVGFYRTGHDSYQSNIDGILSENARKKSDKAIIDGKIAALKDKSKKPRESAWQKSPMRADDPDLINYLKSSTGYGIIAGQGQDHKVIIFDLDELKKCIELGVMNGFPESAVSMARADAGHVFYKLTAADYALLYTGASDEERKSGKITFKDPDNPDGQIGELKIAASQCVGPGSCHWKGGRYTLVHDVPVAVVPLSLIKSIVEKFRKVTVDKKTAAPAKGEKRAAGGQSKGSKRGWLDKIRIEKIFVPPANAEDLGGGDIRFEHPLHPDSKHKRNLVINTEKNVWRCFSCGSGGGPLQAIAVANGLIECQDAQKGTGCLKGILNKVIDLCLVKYGLSAEDIPFALCEGPGRTAKEVLRSRIQMVMDIVEELAPFKVLTDDTIVIYNPETGAYGYQQDNPKHGEQIILALCSHIGLNFIDNRFAEEIIGVVKRRDRVSISEFDSVVGKVLTKTGILDIKTGELSPFTPDFLSLNPCNIEWGGFGADTTEADAFMEWCHPGDEETQDYLWRRYGSIWAGVTGDQVLDIHHSPGTLAGKSTWMNIRNRIFGMQTSWLAPVDIICTSKTGRSGNLQFSAAFMEHKKCVDFAEPGEEAILNDQGVKQVTGEVMNARPPHGRRERPVCHDGGSILAANPQLRTAGGVSPAIKRRLRYTVWNSQVPESEIINEYENVLLEKGGPGFLVRFAEGYRKYLVDKLKPSPNMIKWLDEFIAQNDPLMGFTQAMLMPSGQDSILFEELFEAWEAYFAASGFAGSEKGRGFRIQPTSFGKKLQKQLKELKWSFYSERDKEHSRTYYHGIKFTEAYYNLEAEKKIMIEESQKSFKSYPVSSDQGSK